MDVNPDSELSRLSSLVGDLLLPFTDSDTVSVTKEREKDLLLALSKVLREVQVSTCNNTTSSRHHEDYQNLVNITSHLIILLTFNNQYVRNLTSTVLVSISQFLVDSEHCWEFFIGLLCVCVELSIKHTFHSHSPPSKIGFQGLDCESQSIGFLFKPKLGNADWFTVSSLVQALRNVLKYLKEDNEHDELVESYLKTIHSLLSNVTLDFIDSYLRGPGNDQDCGLQNAVMEGQITVFLGNLLQFLCSVIDQLASSEAFDDYPNEQAIICIIVSLVPKILGWSLVKNRDTEKSCISQYFRHKLLVLMTRLSFQSCLDCSILVSWLQHLHNYFEELLYLPMTSLEYQSNCLEDSPFLLNNIDGDVSSVRSCHLQRQAILLFLRCSLSLINMKEDTNMCSFNGTACSSLVWEAALDGACCSNQNGLLQLYAWLCHCLELEKNVNHEVHVEKLISFVTSLLKLYIHEDDLLFRLLLLLLSVPFCERKFNRGYLASHGFRENILMLVSNVFNHIRLFILFLAELHYDHQVLLDYLISRDTGISCAEYLLRCLRTVCDSWQEFLILSGEIEVINKSFSKRRKTSADSSNFESVSLCRPINGFQLKQSKDESGDGSKHTGSEEGGNVGIRDCLLSLKKSLENLHCKQLFPYNPGVLLKRQSVVIYPSSLKGGCLKLLNEYINVYYVPQNQTSESCVKFCSMFNVWLVDCSSRGGGRWFMQINNFSETLREVGRHVCFHRRKHSGIMMGFCSPVSQNPKTWNGVLLSEVIPPDIAANSDNHFIVLLRIKEPRLD